MSKKSDKSQAQLLRIIDANLNRSKEALRVAEDITRFSLNDAALSKSFKTQRHAFSKAILSFPVKYKSLLESRDSARDVGSTSVIQDKKKVTLKDLMISNLKRSQESSRVLEEVTKVFSAASSKKFQKIRFNLYELEKEVFENFRLYAITSLTEESDTVLEQIESAYRGGADIIQLRSKELSDGALLRLAKKIKVVSEQYRKLFFINDRVDLAILAQADGVHVGQNDLPINEVRKVLTQANVDMFIGKSTHHIDHARVAQSEGVDYIGVGPVYSTPTKPGKTPVGLDYVSQASREVTIPFVAIGGINHDNMDEVINAGARRIAVVRSIFDAEDVYESTRKFCEKLESGVSHV